jgi:hypothetical protein
LSDIERISLVVPTMARPPVGKETPGGRRAHPNDARATPHEKSSTPRAEIPRERRDAGDCACLIDFWIA